MSEQPNLINSVERSKQIRELRNGVNHEYEDFSGRVTFDTGKPDGTPRIGCFPSIILKTATRCD